MKKLGKTVLKLSVTDFVSCRDLTGDIDDRGGFSPLAADIGVKLHQIIQQRRAAQQVGYKSEQSVKHVFTCPEAYSDISVEVSGRIDGMWKNLDDDFILEEIKTTLSPEKLKRQLEQSVDHPYRMQLLVYQWIQSQHTGKALKAQILLVNASTLKEVVVPVDFDLVHMDAWIHKTLLWIGQTWKKVEAFRTEQRVRAPRIKLPYGKKRQGQVLLSKDVAETCRDKRQLLAQAPTGLGKTAGVIIPALSDAMHRGEKLFHITPKNSQLREAEKLLRKLKKHGGPSGLILTAKAKICMKAPDQPKCRPDLCVFAKGHYDKVQKSQLIELVLKEPVITARELRHIAETYEVCPYELGRQVMPWVDMVAGDYHYVLSPRADLNQRAALPLLHEPKPNLSIDEAHNISERSLDWYSGSIQPLPGALIDIQSEALKKVLLRTNEWFDEQAKTLAHLGTCGTTSKSQVLSNFDPSGLQELMEEWNACMPEVLEESQAVASPEDLPIVLLWFEWLNFSALCELPPELFFTTFDPSAKVITRHCINAGPLIKEQLDSYNAVIAFSATLKPFHFQINTAGFQSDRVSLREYSSPFPAKNRLVLAVPQISTAWKDREQSPPRIAEVIQRVIALKDGNYAAYFPSFDLLRQTMPYLKLPDDIEVIEQTPRASQTWAKSTIETLKHHRSILLLAVQGGILSEGVDLPGDSLIGAFIVGPALPMVTREREERRKHFENQFGAGFAHAYIYPAMAKSMQAAGRVIRTPSDRGFVILIDPRFLSPDYVPSMPSDWLIDGKVEHLRATALLQQIKTFWEAAPDLENTRFHSCSKKKLMRRADDQASTGQL